jgi:hypothetical protein
MVFKGPLDIKGKTAAELVFTGCGDDKGKNGSITPGTPDGAIPGEFIKSAQVSVEVS